LGRPRAGRRGTLSQNVPLGSRVVSQKVNFLGQGNKGRLISSAVRRRTGEYPPARLLLPGGLEPRSHPPGALVSFSGMSACNTPCVLKLEARSLRVTMTLSGYVEWTREIAVEAGKPIVAEMQRIQ
jgi:hypothetical protein